MTVREFLNALWDGKYFIVVAVVVGVVCGTYYADRQPETYEATTTVQINSTDTGDVAAPADAGTVDTDPRLVEAPAVLERVAEAETVAPGMTPRQVATAITGLYDAPTNVVSITATADSPQGAVALANAAASAYVEYLPTVVDEQITEIDTQRDALRERLDSVDEQLDKNAKDPLAGAERETIISQYQTLSASRNTLDSIVDPAQVLTPATVADASLVGMPRVLLVGVGGLAGLAIGGSLALSRRALDGRLRGRPDTTEASGAPVLAALYEVKKASRRYRKVPVLPISRRLATPFTESIRELRTAVQVAVGDNDHAVVVVTAADSHAPRSFITANLAASWAMSGRKTVAVAGDLRQEGLEDMLPPPHGPDVSDDGVRRTQVPNLRLLTIQDPDMDPADFLATSRVKETIEATRSTAEVLVIDAPPVLGAADATILGGYADCVVLVATVGRTKRVVLGEAVDRLHINDAPLAGIALAGVKGDSGLKYAATYGEGTSAESAESAAETAPDDETSSAGSPPPPDGSGERRGAAQARPGRTPERDRDPAHP